MKKTKLMITGPGGTKYVLLEQQGTTVGRSAGCDVVLEDAGVSRHHAKISQDPFGRWIVEDLGSHNGVFVDGERVKAHAVPPGRVITISNFTLSILPDSEPEIAAGKSIKDGIGIIDKGLEEEIVSYRADTISMLSPALMHSLNEYASRLLKLTDLAQFYSEASVGLAKLLDTLVAIVRLPAGSDDLPRMPEILACHFGSADVDAAVDRSYLHFSKRVLEAVRSSEAPVMAGSGSTGGQDMMLTVVDDYKPHVVYAARVNEVGESVDVLYIDMLQEKSPKEMFDFIEAAGRQINLAQKNLFLIELEKKEKELRQANVQLLEKDRIKDEYVSRVTHDIKGHLAAIHSCLFIAGDESAGALSEKQADFLGRATARTKQVTAFVKELLNLTRMRLSGQMEMEAFLLSDSISKALETVARKAEDKSITLTSKVAEGMGEIIGHEFSINEMLTNLLFNAIKYTPEGKTVHLEAQKYEDHVQIDFVDTGIGIPAEEVGHVFDEFFRATNAKKSEKDGTGLGLSLVKQIVDRHGGSISAQSVEGQGSTFTVKLPVQKLIPEAGVAKEAGE